MPFSFLHIFAYYMFLSDDFSRFDAIKVRASQILIQIQPKNEGILEYSASVSP